MMRSLRMAGLAWGALAVGGSFGCDQPEASAPIESSSSSAPATADTEITADIPPSTSITPNTVPSDTVPSDTATSNAAKSTNATSSSAKPAPDSAAASSAQNGATAKAASAADPAAAQQQAPGSRPRPVNVSRNSGGVQEITFDTIKFPMEKEQDFERSMLTGDVLALDGRSIRIRGYILPSFQQTGLTQFVLVRDNLQCCFGPGAALFDCIIVEMKPGRSTDYTVRPVSVEGTFTLAEMVNPDDGKHLAIYHLDGEKVQ